MSHPIFRVEFSTANAAFDDAPATEIGRVLRDLADKIERDGIPDWGDAWRLFDANGNRIGLATHAPDLRAADEDED